jgi:hypothetical protein
MAPWLRRVVPGRPPPLDLPPEQARRYLFLSVQEFAGRADQKAAAYWGGPDTWILLATMALPENVPSG